jgi:threonine dehydrogenase-like Zn-dependent dehydrogenase
VPPGRAILAANMETALNILWDGGAGPGDRITVVGAGVVGALVGWLAARLPGAEVTLVDVEPRKATLAAAFGCAFLPPEAVTPEADLVIHASGSGEGLVTAIAAAGREATIVEASWHGTGRVSLPLGGAFHSQRLRLVSSQVGALPAQRAPRWSHARRLAKALALLSDPALDALISGETALADLPRRYGEILADPGTLCHRVRY